MKRIFASLALALSIAVPAAADTAEPEVDLAVGKVLHGTVATRTATGSVKRTGCAITGLPSTYEISETGNHYVALNELIYHIGGKVFRFGGLARLKFDDEDSGQVKFDLLGGKEEKIGDITFSQYERKYVADRDRLKVTFDLEYEFCTVPFVGLYRD